jgi:O-antigen ligase
MNRERLDGWCERGIVGLVLAILVYTPLATGAVRPQDFVIVEWLTVGILLCWLCRFWVNPKHRLLWPPVCWAVVLFMLYAVGRYRTADIEYVARQEMIKVLVYGFIFLAVLHNLHKQETTQVVGTVVVILGMLISLYALYQFLGDSERVWHFVRPEIYRQRGSGTFICPNHLAGYLELALPLGLAYTLTGRFSHLAKIFLGYAALAIFTGILVTISRGAWIATGITLVVLFYWLMRQRDYRLQSVLVFASLIAISASILYTVKLSRSRTEALASLPEAADLRWRIWGAALNIWQDHFWWGAGPAHFDYRFRQYRPAHDQVQWRPVRVHNDYLNTLADWGTVGAAVVAAGWLIFYWGILRSWKFVQRAQNDLAGKRSNKSSFVMGGALGLLAVLLHSAVDFNMHIPATAILTVSLMALVSGHFRFATEAYWHTVHWPMRGLITGALMAGLLYLGKQSWQQTVESYWLAKAEGIQEFSSGQIVALTKAYAAEPRNFETSYNIGEGWRMQSWQGGDNYRDLATRALEWFQRSVESNPYYPYTFVRYGMCLDWLGRHTEADSYFNQAAALDPNGYYTAANVGWHYVQLEDWATAKAWFEKSLSLNWISNPIARSYLQIVQGKLAEDGRPK